MCRQMKLVKHSKLAKWQKGECMSTCSSLVGGSMVSGCLMKTILAKFH
uniref:Uncharacterized protein n=1 Tax=Arundo donax TaxID=35708 RepID=A0A0A9E389_ARUDO